MPTDELILTFVRLLASQAPLVIISSTGIWFAVARRRHLARVSVFTAWGFGLLIVYSLARATSALASQLQINTRGQSQFLSRDYLFWLNFLQSATYPLLLAGISLIGVAVFLDRNAVESNSTAS